MKIRACSVSLPALTLARAHPASQILLLRREVKFLQKQWNTARRDGDSVSHREVTEQLNGAVGECDGALSAGLCVCVRTCV